jgi:hypothetical protein
VRKGGSRLLDWHFLLKGGFLRRPRTRQESALPETRHISIIQEGVPAMGDKPDKPVHITVANGQISVDQKTVTISKGSNNQVIWKANADWTIQFDKGVSPFRLKTFSGAAGRAVPSGPAVNGTPGSDYKYVISSPGAQDLDPGVHVDL